VDLGVERPSHRGALQWLDGLAMPALPRERHSQIELRIRVIGPSGKDSAKALLGRRKLFLLQVRPPIGEERVGRRRLTHRQR
jgi:hypothetical protein